MQVISFSIPFFFFFFNFWTVVWGENIIHTIHTSKGIKFDEVMSRIITCIGFIRVYYIRMWLFGVMCLFVYFIFPSGYTFLEIYWKLQENTACNLGIKIRINLICRSNSKSKLPTRLETSRSLWQLTCKEISFQLWIF